uniref:Uncharacterized protein n=1 Tax=Tanacetum cinerariifolium TaxID=118510 RepID=A0A6L2KRL2_TANCI|nr:hypothetical protein [Tanacetum cinerariifolium]
MNRNQDSSNRTLNVEETASKAMVAIDGADFDWSYMADDEVPTKMALMAFSNSKRSSNSLSLKAMDLRPANCKYHQRERMVSGNNYTRVNYNNSTRKTHPNGHINMAPIAVLMKTGLRPLNTARPVNTAHPKTIVYSARPLVIHKKKIKAMLSYHSPDGGGPMGPFRRDLNSMIQQWMLQAHDGNMSYLSDIKEFDGGYVTDVV